MIKQRKEYIQNETKVVHTLGYPRRVLQTLSEHYQVNKILQWTDTFK